MRILILSAATGGGHMRAAHALEEAIRRKSPETEVRVVDFLKEISPILDKTICDGYHFLATKTPKVFGKLYQKTNEETPFSQIVPKFNSLFCQELVPLMEEFRPDAVVTTHPFATEMVSRLKEKGALFAPLICIMTDYGPHKAWFADRVDAYIVSAQDMVEEMVMMGVDRNKIFPFGIPVHSVFFYKEDKNKLQQELGLTPGLPTILIMAGSFGVTNIAKIYRSIAVIDMPFQMIVITGRNQRLYDYFSEIIPESPKKTKLVFFTNEVEKYMHASDLIITKPGGLTVSEALACNIPLAVFDAIPGQEEDNANFLLQHEMAIRIQKGEDCADSIRALLQDHERLEKMRSSCASFDKSQSPTNILSLIGELLKQYQL
ncbi:MAG TPA: glycosyltransferase [Candidatus Gallacutalibacter pullicola]|uniref:Glycosyltransferase n=1 Tax=Candidatus Gallacutalibacter pullicola TaxID=2840830 RepID=A0A9D1J077_9FIRM|nr:glycosyltransferase [Candidatus Gallacutalibacter pullicola]